MFAGSILLAVVLSDPLTSFRNARALIDRSAVVHGLAAEAAPLSLSLEGDFFQVTQSRRPEPPFLRTPYRETILFDPAGRRFRHARETEWPYFTMKRTTIAAEERVVDVDDALGAASAGGRYPEVKRRLNWRAPSLLLLAARDAGGSLRALGRDGRDEVVIFPQEDGQVVTVSIDAATHRVTRARWLEAAPLFGDVEWETRFSADRVVLRRNGEVIADLRVRQLPATIDPRAFVLPAVPPQSAPPAMSFDELADGVVLIRNAGRADYHSLLVVFEDHSLLVEPLGGPVAAQAILAEIAKRYPRQPLRWVAATHHHDDHVSALRDYLAAGATLLSPPALAAFFRTVADAAHTIMPDALVRSGKRASIVPIRPPRRIADARNEVELLSIGPTEHADESLIAWLPRAGIVFQGDLFRGGTVEAPRKSTLTFAAALQRLELDVRRIAGAHGEVATIDEFRAAVGSAR